MVTTSNEELADRLRKARWMGIDRDTWSRTAPSKRPSYAWQYTVEELGYKCHMHDISATIGLVQLQKLDHMNQVRHNIFKTYNENLESLSDVQVPIEKDYVESSHHLYCIKCKDRDDLITHLKLNDVAPGVHYYPCHLFPYYKKYRTRLPVTEKIWKEILTLPLFPDITPQETHQVISAVKSFYE
jgi:perosamine synthetase